MPNFAKSVSRKVVGVLRATTIHVMKYNCRTCGSPREETNTHVSIVAELECGHIVFLNRDEIKKMPKKKHCFECLEFGEEDKQMRKVLEANGTVFTKYEIGDDENA